MNELERWANFYLLMSGAAATLLGLMFVVIALAAERRSGDTAKIHIYLTPTVIYFASVLCLAALLTFPNHTRLTASLCTCLGGFVGLVYSGSFFRILRGGKKNYYELQDWIVYAVIPFAAYGVQVFGGVLLFRAPQRGLTLVAASMLSLLALAVRNSWAIAVDVVSTPRGQQNSK
jgi:hypothetical protein